MVKGEGARVRRCEGGGGVGIGAPCRVERRGELRPHEYIVRAEVDRRALDTHALAHRSRGVAHPFLSGQRQRGQASQLERTQHDATGEDRALVASLDAHVHVRDRDLELPEEQGGQVLHQLGPHLLALLLVVLHGLPRLEGVALGALGLLLLLLIAVAVGRRLGSHQEEDTVDADDERLLAQLAPRDRDSDLAQRAADSLHGDREGVESLGAQLQIPEQDLAGPHGQVEALLVEADHKRP